MDEMFVDIRCPADREYAAKDGQHFTCDAFMGAVSNKSDNEHLVLRCPVCRKMYDVISHPDFVIIREIKGRVEMRTAWRVVNG
jgi:uncharacterized protein YbaR (Trm112 family)